LRWETKALVLFPRASALTTTLLVPLFSYQVFYLIVPSHVFVSYGNISPTNDISRFFCIFYSILGIPLVLFTLANFNKLVTKGFWYLMFLLARSKLCNEANMPLPLIILLFICTFYFGSIFIDHTGRRHGVDDLYFSFISFTTVGFGDLLPVTDSLKKLCITLSYLIWGIILTTALFGVHHLGRRFTGARDVPVWLGGHCITVSELLQVVANEFNVSALTENKGRPILYKLTPKFVNIRKLVKFPIRSIISDSYYTVLRVVHCTILGYLGRPVLTICAGPNIIPIFWRNAGLTIVLP
uniref:Ion_trans_2 domain-containing protein n=1 Tax=Angiostrongylus cantonensis TaxID=6313 RepID=A0A0K0DCF7_ANGCA